ncbi:hypothetical protein [Microbacterium phyllosphaerae]|uniref:hypothetical protein n=1 Tax=Microbacterium phyllosphaerae TaxID=124798 RepID=UPI002166E9DB|nr:hypothetical protein [Microbacterium phyllosphaerae]MCS3443722.1 hypothetical protein [Microbacterium phyllosphaerae]
MTDTAPESTADRRIRDTVTRRFVRDPLIIGLVLLAAAIAWTLAGDDLSFFPFLLMLLGGFGLAFSFVNATMEMRPARKGVVLQLGVAAVLTALMIFVVEFGGADLLAHLPEPARAVILVLQIAAGPAVGWIWLGLLSRISDLFRRRDRSTRPAPTPPDWQREEHGDGSRVEFRALDLRMRALTLVIIGVVLVLGLAGTALLIALDDAVMSMGPRVAIIVMGAVVGLPAYLLLRATLRRRTLSCAVAFGNDELRIRTDSSTHRIPFTELETLVWRMRSDYSRVEVRGADTDLSLIVGLAKPSEGRTAELPALPRRVVRRLELAGVTLEPSRRAEMVRFRRAA